MNFPSRSKLAAYLVGIFAAGAISGTVVALNVTRQSSAKQQVPTMERACDRMRQKLQKRLQLTPEQMSRIDPILKDTERELHEVQRRSLEQVEGVFEKSNARIARELTPEQRPQLEEIEKEQREAYARRSKNNHPRKTHTNSPASGQSLPMR